VTVIAAPPGSGKTSLLRAWSERAANTHRIAFLSVARDQRDAQQFWLGVLGALLDAVRSPNRQQADAATPGFDGRAMVERLLLELADLPEPAVLVIDDLHELHSDEALAQLEDLLNRLPTSASAVLSARRDPRIRLSALRLADQVASIRANDLMFSEHETRELLRASGLFVSTEDAAALHRRTEGWAAGLRLAALSLQGHPDPTRFVAEFSGTNRAIGEYLISEMLERQAPDVRDMLLRTSMLDRVNGELADLLSGHNGCDRFLLELEDANAFVVSIDPQREWFRYHQLLADFLYLELRRSAPEEVPGLHTRAARWLQDRGQIVDAVRHLQRGRAWPEAAQLLADNLLRMTLDGQEATIEALLEAFPEGISADDPELALAHAAVQLRHGHQMEAGAQLTRAQSHLADTSADRRPAQTMAVAAMQLALARRSGQFTQVIDQVNRLESSIADTTERPMIGSELNALVLMNRGIVESWLGRLADAERHLAQGAALANAIGRPYVEVMCRSHLCFPSGRVSCAAARELSYQAIALAERHGLADRPIIVPALGALAGVTIWMGRFEEAERALRRASEFDDADIDPSAMVLLHTATGMLHTGRGEHASALEAFLEAARVEALLDGTHVLAPKIAGWAAGAQARLGEPDLARAALDAFRHDPEHMGDIYNARAVICMEEKEPALALDALRAVLDASAPNVAPFTLVETLLLAASAYVALGDRVAAATAVEQALAVAEPDRLIFPFAVTAASQPLDALPRHSTSHAGLLADIEDVLDGLAPASAHRGQSALAIDLSPTELRVVGYLPTNLTRTEIARQLYVSVNTVNTHVRNIYSKLGVGDRSAAVRRARELRLLSSGVTPRPSH
jgi:LuxR family transcriptional regulator, maltose regulon positive regulatory protein